MLQSGRGQAPNLKAVLEDSQGYRTFAQNAIKDIQKVTELIRPQTEEEPQNWFTLKLEQEQKDSLVQAAHKAGLSLEEFIWALVWTKVKEILKVRKEQEERREERLRKEHFRIVNVYFDNDLIEKYESKFGQIKSKTDVENKLKDLLLKELG